MPLDTQTETSPIAIINGFKVKKVDTLKDKVLIVFEGRRDEMVNNNQHLAETLKELSSAAFLNLLVSLSVYSGTYAPAEKATK